MVRLILGNHFFILPVSKYITNRGTPMLVAGGYRFYKDKDFGMKTRWHCSNKKHKCKAAIITIADSVVKTNLEHNHLPSFRGTLPEFVSVLNNLSVYDDDRLNI